MTQAPQPTRTTQATQPTGTIALIAVVDVGTSAVKAALVDTAGVTRASGEAPLDTRSGPGGVMEQDAPQWWDAVRGALSRCEGRDAVVALAATGQMQDLVLVDDRDAVGPVLLYSDTRAAEQHAELAATVGDWEDRTGNHQDPSTVAAKIRWTADHHPERLARTRAMLFGAAGYVLWRAGGEPACDVVTASTTGLLDVGARDWFTALVERAGGPPGTLPRLVSRHDPADAVVGRLAAGPAAELGLPAGVPLVLAAGDAGAATDGLVGSAPGSGYVSLGTTGWFAQVRPADPAARPSALHSLVLPGWDRRLQIGAVLAAGAAAAWARTTFLPGLGTAAVEDLAAARLASGPPAAVLCLPSLAGERTPVRDAEARGTFVGLTDTAGPVDLYLAMLTGVAMNLRHAADAMGATAPDPLPVVGGGARSGAWRRIMASVFDVPVVTAPHGEPGLVSAAATAARALGLDHTIRPLFHGPLSPVTPPGPEAATFARLLPAHRDLYDVLRPAFGTLAATTSPGRHHP